MPVAHLDVRSSRWTGKHVLDLSLTGCDPNRTLRCIEPTLGLRVVSAGAVRATIKGAPGWPHPGAFSSFDRSVLDVTKRSVLGGNRAAPIEPVDQLGADGLHIFVRVGEMERHP